MKKEEENLTPDQVQEKLLKVTIANNKRLKSIDYSLAFICLVIIISIIFTIFSFFVR
jgi:hypothetical protein